MLSGLFTRSAQAKATVALKELKLGCQKLLSEAGTSNGEAVAAEVIRLWGELDDAARLAFFEFLDALAPEKERVLRAANAYAAELSRETILELQRAVYPPRRVLLQRLNRASGGVATVVAMRRALAGLVRDRPELRAVDADFSHLLASWFNPGFLYLRQVDWNSPAALLEKIIRHEAVHAIRDWSDLRRRLQPDRRCFAFFHPQLPDEPLIFVEVALEGRNPAQDRPPHRGKARGTARGKASQRGRVLLDQQLRAGTKGVSLGNFLIKRWPRGCAVKCLRSSGSVPCLPYPVSEVVDEGTRRRGGRGDPHAPRRGSRAAGLRRARRRTGRGTTRPRSAHAPPLTLRAMARRRAAIR